MLQDVEFEHVAAALERLLTLCGVLPRFFEIGRVDGFTQDRNSDLVRPAIGFVPLGKDPTLFARSIRLHTQSRFEGRKARDVSLKCGYRSPHFTSDPNTRIVQSLQCSPDRPGRVDISRQPTQ
jgi:hypothetical protein